MGVNNSVYIENPGFVVWGDDTFVETYEVDLRETIETGELLMPVDSNIDNSISLWGIKDTNPASTFYICNKYSYNNDNEHFYSTEQRIAFMFGIDLTEDLNVLGEINTTFPNFSDISFNFTNYNYINKNTYNAITKYGDLNLEYGDFDFYNRFYYFVAGMDKMEIHPSVSFRKWVIADNAFDDSFGEKTIYFKDINNYINEEKKDEFRYIVTRYEENYGIRVNNNDTELKCPSADDRALSYPVYYQFSNENSRFQAMHSREFGNNQLGYEFNIYNYGPQSGLYTNMQGFETRLQVKNAEGEYTRITGVPFLAMKHVPLTFKLSDVFNLNVDYYKEFYFLPTDNECGWKVEMSREYDDGKQLDFCKVRIVPHIYSLKLYHDILCNYGMKLNPDEELKPSTYDNYWWPVLESQYISGTWAKGVIEANKQTTTIDYNNSAYKPNPSPDGPGPVKPDYTDPSESGVIDNVPSLSGLSFFSNLYALSYSALKNMSATLYSADDAKMQEFIDGLKLMGANPIDAIVSIRLYPFSFDTVSYTNANFWQKGISSIRFGRTELTMSEEVYKASGFGSIVLNCGSIVVRGKHNNFLDYEPFSKVTLWLPYVGFVNLSFSEIADRELSVRYFVDLLTGSAMACVYINNNLYTNIQTQLSIELPITATQNSSKSITTALSLVKSTGNLVNSPLTAAIDTINTASQALLTSNSTNFQTKGNYNSNLYQMCDQRVLLIHETPEILNEDYQEINGYVLNETRTVGEFSGFCTFENVQINCDGTEDEKRQIKEILESGVYL